MKVVQIGACQGNDHVTRLIEGKEVELLLLVEANPLNIPALTECYKNTKNVVIEQIGITHTDQDSFRLYYSTTNGPDYQFSSVDMNHIIKLGQSPDNIKHFDIQCKTLNSLLREHNLYELDYLFIDIEGHDADVVMSLDLKEFNIKNVEIEILHLGKRIDEVFNNFFDNGYEVFDGLEKHNWDRMFVKK